MLKQQKKKQLSPRCLLCLRIEFALTRCKSFWRGETIDKELKSQLQKQEQSPLNGTKDFLILQNKKRYNSKVDSKLQFPTTPAYFGEEKRTFLCFFIMWKKQSGGNFHPGFYISAYLMGSNHEIYFIFSHPLVSVHADCRYSFWSSPHVLKSPFALFCLNILFCSQGMFFEYLVFLIHCILRGGNIAKSL